MGFYSEKIFPHLCSRAVKRYDEQRREVIGQATGRVLEIGVGVGSNFEFYTGGVTEVVGLETSDGMLIKAARRVAELQRLNRRLPKFTLVKGSATAMGFPDNSFDAVVSFLVFCSIDGPGTAAAEIHRVLKPGGRLLFFEHVLARDDKLRKWQFRLNPLWKKIACGCHLTRDTRSEFEHAGFVFQEIKEFLHPESMKISSFKIKGVAVKSGAHQP